MDMAFRLTGQRVPEKTGMTFRLTIELVQKSDQR
jgi:hypothetical protein